MASAVRVVLLMYINPGMFNHLGLTNDVLCQAAQVSSADLGRNHQRPAAAGRITANDIRRVIPIFVTERRLRQAGGKTEAAELEVQILSLADEYEALISGARGTKMSPGQASQEVIRRWSGRYDSLLSTASPRRSRKMRPAQTPEGIRHSFADLPTLPRSSI
jgi:hypothetical protein